MNYLPSLGWCVGTKSLNDAGFGTLRPYRNRECRNRECRATEQPFIGSSKHSRTSITTRLAKNGDSKSPFFNRPLTEESLTGLIHGYSSSTRRGTASSIERLSFLPGQFPQITFASNRRPRHSTATIFPTTGAGPSNKFSSIRSSVSLTYRSKCARVKHLLVYVFHDVCRVVDTGFYKNFRSRSSRDKHVYSWVPAAVAPPTTSD